MSAYKQMLSLCLAGVTCLMVGTAANAEATMSQKLTQAGYSSLQQGDAASALTLLTRALSADPNNTAAKRLLAYANMQSGYAHVAAKLLEETIKVQPTDGDFASLGDAYLALEQLPKAEANYSKSLRLNPANRQAIVGYVNTLVATDKRPVAREYCKQILSSSRDMVVIQALTEKLREIDSYATQTSINPG